MLKIIKVKGNSLLPTIANGDYLLIRTFLKKPAINQVIVFDHPTYGTIVKKVCQLLSNGNYLATSTHAEGITSKQIGEISNEQIIGIKLLHIKS